MTSTLLDLHAFAAPPGLILDRDDVQSDVIALAPRYGTDPSILWPVTTTECGLCGFAVHDLAEMIAGRRVNGDSRYGFHAVHKTCASLCDGVS